MRSTDIDPSWLQELGLAIGTPERTLICCPCQHAVLSQPRSAWQHLSTVHCIDDRHKVKLDCLASLDLTDIPQLQPRRDHSDADPLLKTISGFACLHCADRTSSEQLLWRHLSSRHHIARIEVKADQDYRHILLQQWAISGSTARQA
jgi:hypothetical protein